MPHGFQAQRGLLSPLREVAPMHNPERDPFYEGLWADIQEGIEAADRGDLFDLEDVARELRGESATAAES
jgi:hypothetical protein